MALGMLSSQQPAAVAATAKPSAGQGVLNADKNSPQTTEHLNQE